MHDAAFRRLVVDSTIKTEEAHIRSHRFTELANSFLKTGDDLSYNEQKKFEQVWTTIMARLFQRLDLLLTSCNNAGNGIVEAGFWADGDHMQRSQAGHFRCRWSRELNPCNLC